MSFIKASFLVLHKQIIFIYCENFKNTQIKLCVFVDKVQKCLLLQQLANRVITVLGRVNGSAMN